MNNGAIDNLPDECIVEAPGYVDFNGISIPKVGSLPLGCTAVLSASVWVQKLAVEAAVAGDDLLLRQAMMMDPLTGAVCNPPEIWQMVDEMLIVQEQWLPQYKKAIAQAKARWKTGNLLPTKEGYRGAVRLPVKSVEELNREKAEK
jgi:alpha-galactosidase